MKNRRVSLIGRRLAELIEILEKQLDIPPIPEFIEMIHDAGGKLYACKATVDMFHLKPEDSCDEVEKVLTVGEFYELSAGAEIIFT